MNNYRPDDGYLAELQAHPLDLRGLPAPDAARTLYEFLQKHFEPGDECSLWSPVEAKSRGYSAFWRVSWEAGPMEWGVLLTLGESMWLQEFGLGYDHRPEVLLQSGDGWYTEPHFRFDIGFVEDLGKRGFLADGMRTVDCLDRPEASQDAIKAPMAQG